MVDKDYEYLTAFKLKKGSHESPGRGLCAMEAVAWLEGLPHSDAPVCTSPAIAEWVILMNDLFRAKNRQRLIPYLPRLVGTNQPEVERARENAVGDYCRLVSITDGNADECFDVLDALLAMGKPGTFTADPVARTEDYKAMVAPNKE